MRACQERGEYVSAATTGRRTAHHVLQATEKLGRSLDASNAGRKRFWRRVEELRQRDALREGSIRRSNRHATATLELERKADEELRRCAE